MSSAFGLTRAEERKFAAITQDLTLDARTANHDGGITKDASKVLRKVDVFVS